MVNTGKEYRISRNELDRTILLGILAVEVIQMADSLFDRAAFIEKVRNTFKPLEASLPDGDAFDYEEAALFSGIVNGSQEHVVVVDGVVLVGLGHGFRDRLAEPHANADGFLGRVGRALQAQTAV